MSSEKAVPLQLTTIAYTYNIRYWLSTSHWLSKQYCNPVKLS